MCITLGMYCSINTLRPRQNCCHFADGIFKCIILNENKWISLKISLKFVPKVRINNILALVQIMVWHWPGDKPLSEPLMLKLLMHICVTWPQWVRMHNLVYICAIHFYPCLYNSSPFGQSGHHSAEDIFKCIFMKETICILIHISLRFVPKGSTDNKSALGWH